MRLIIHVFIKDTYLLCVGEVNVVEVEQNTTLPLYLW